MADDPKIGKVVLFGGNIFRPSGDSILLNDTWTYNGRTWTKESPPISPSARELAAMAYDPAIGKVVLFGGSDFVGNSFHPLRDTWTYDGKAWTQVHPATTPSAGGSMAYDPAIGKLVLFGANNSGDQFSLGHSTSSRNEVWSFDGSTWTNELVTVIDANSPSPPDGPIPCARLTCPIVYDAALGRLLYFSGDASDWGRHPWTYDGVKWTPEPPTSGPVPPASTSIAYDPGLGHTVLFGGCTVDYSERGGVCVSHNGTWTYDGTTWAGQSPSTSPPPRSDGLMVYDSTLKGLLLFGAGLLGGSSLNDTWIYGPAQS